MADVAFVFGCRGQLGVELMTVLQARGYAAVGFDRSEIDISNAEQVERAFAAQDPAIVINAGALSHTSWSLHDAVAAFDGPTVELHLSNPAGREPFRHTSVVAPVADGLVAGFGGLGYELAIEAVRRLLDGGDAAPQPPAAQPPNEG